jgi:maleate cis-trans isomerase
MEAWERKLELIVPSWTSVKEYQFQSVLAPSISVHTTRLALTADDEENIARMAREALTITRSNFQILEIIQPVERQLGKPGLSSNVCVLWKMPRVSGDIRTVRRAGRLSCEAPRRAA